MSPSSRYCNGQTKTTNEPCKNKLAAGQTWCGKCLGHTSVPQRTSAALAEATQTAPKADESGLRHADAYASALDQETPDEHSETAEEPVFAEDSEPIPDDQADLAVMFDEGEMDMVSQLKQVLDGVIVDRATGGDGALNRDAAEELDQLLVRMRQKLGRQNQPTDPTDAQRIEAPACDPLDMPDIQNIAEAFDALVQAALTRNTADSWHSALRTCLEEMEYDRDMVRPAVNALSSLFANQPEESKRRIQDPVVLLQNPAQFTMPHDDILQETLETLTARTIHDIALVSRSDEESQSLFHAAVAMLDSAAATGIVERVAKAATTLLYTSRAFDALNAPMKIPSRLLDTTQGWLIARNKAAAAGVPFVWEGP